jgi:hypothetical protein
VRRVIGNECAQCRADIIAPEWSEHLSDHCVRNVWSCEVCGYRFEDTVYLSHELADNQGVEAMDNGVISQAESDEKILTFDLPDEVLERAASAEQNALTMLYCTSDWYNCGLPQMVAF